MIDFEVAKRIVEETWLPLCEERLATQVIVRDEQCVEYEWGWMIAWGPKDPEKLRPECAGYYCFPFLVDRVTGNSEPTGSKGPEWAIIHMLQGRPAECCGLYPVASSRRLDTFADYERTGAFTPVRKPAKSDARL